MTDSVTWQRTRCQLWRLNQQAYGLLSDYSLSVCLSLTACKQVLQTMGQGILSRLRGKKEINALIVGEYEMTYKYQLGVGE